VPPLKPIGFWSYTSADDAASGGRLSRLRLHLAKRLHQQLGREPRLFQDRVTIPAGTQWEQEIEKALAEASFFIPILTPGFLQSEWCTKEVQRFREHMEARGRDDLILPVHYLDVRKFYAERRGECFDPAVLDYLRSLQWVDFRELEPSDADTAEVRRWLGVFAERIEETLYRAAAPPVAVSSTTGPPTPVVPVAAPRKLPEFSPGRRVDFRVLPSARDDEKVGVAEASPPRPPGSPPRPPAPNAPLPPATRRPVLRGVAVIVALVACVLVIRQLVPPAPVPAPPPSATTAPTAKNPPVQPAPAPDGSSALVTTAPPTVPVQSATAAAPPPPKEFRDTCPADAICPEMVLIQHGSFQMGTTDEELDREKVPNEYRGWEKPRHPVTIPADFYLGKHDVTVREFAAFVRATGARPAGGCSTWEAGSDGESDGKYERQPKLERTWEKPGFSQTESDPVVCISYDDALAYIDWMNRETGTQAYRLPSEAEWEYAARAGTTTARFWGDSRDAACRFANVADLSLAKQIGILGPEPERYFNCSDGYVFTAPAGSFRSNPFGLFDMLGNVWQWTADCANDNHQGASAAGTVRTTGDCWLRVLRGGSWGSSPGSVRVWGATGGRGGDTGFRVARTLLRP
jgi:sulfatase modifying factor 1